MTPVPVVHGSDNGHLRTVCEYVQLNPVQARLLTPEQPLREGKKACKLWFCGTLYRR